MAEAKKYYSRCDLGSTKVGETVVVSGAVDGRITAKGLTSGTGKDEKKYVKFMISVQNQKKNLAYFAGLLGASESDLFSTTADNGSEYTTLTVYLSGRDADRAEKNLKAGDIVDVAGFLRFAKKDDKRYITFYANGYKLNYKKDGAAETKPASAPAQTPSTTSAEGSYTPEAVAAEEDDLPF